MNIRSLSNPAQILAADKVETQRREISSSTATERDADGRRDQQQEKPWRPLTEEEMHKVLEKLRHHEGIQRHQLLVKLQVEGDKRIVTIESADGVVVKRIIERDLFFYLFEEQTNNFNLVKRTA